MRNLAVIPARSGSKGLKDKNIKELLGKPLLAYSIEAALQSEVFDEVHVSTDSREYADLAQKYGADVPFLRNSNLSSDTASTWDAMKYVLKQYEKLGKKYDTITVLQPTSPLRDAEDIKAAFAFFKSKDANMISSVCEMEHSPLWSNTLPPDLSMKNFEDEKVAMLPRQQLPTYYRENGAIYIVRTEHLFHEKNIYENNCYAYIMDNLHSVDIDSELDFMIAKAILENCN